MNHTFSVHSLSVQRFEAWLGCDEDDCDGEDCEEDPGTVDEDAGVRLLLRPGQPGERGGCEPGHHGEAGEGVEWAVLSAQAAGAGQEGDQQPGRQLESEAGQAGQAQPRVEAGQVGGGLADTRSVEQLHCTNVIRKYSDLSKVSTFTETVGYH